MRIGRKQLYSSAATAVLVLAAHRAAPTAPAPASSPAAPPAASTATPDFTRQILPLLTQRCVACHGPKIAHSGLRLDIKNRAFEGGDGGTGIVPGKSGASELFRRITSPDPKRRMPPGSPLKPVEIAAIKAWIDDGAAWPDEHGNASIQNPRASTAGAATHWSFRPVVRPPLPAVKNSRWILNPIDAFILARLEQKGLAPSPPADRPTLIRRVYLDLTGLPPTPEELDAFVADSAPGAYERVVDRLLASPQYGERWARHWLDQARYADSNGYTIDSARSIWKYRDWVIQALNRDLPFDQFTIEQIAGDMLPNATQDQIVATGFHRNTLFNEEGGTDREQFRVESVVDRIATTGTVFLGLTVGCAQCHTHKFDPITQREYYQLFAFLNNADEPKLELPTPTQASELASAREAVSRAQKALAEYDRSLPDRLAMWEGKLAAGVPAGWTQLEVERASSAGGATLTPQADNSVLAGGTIPDTDTYTVTAPAPGGLINAVRLEALTHPSIAGTGPGLTPHGNFVLNEFELTTGNSNARAPFASAVADHAQASYPVAGAIDGDLKTGWGVSAPNAHVDRQAVFTLKTPLTLPVGTPLTFTFRHAYNGKRYAIGRFRISVSSLAADQIVPPLAPRLRQILALPPSQRTMAQRDMLVAEVQKIDPERLRLNTDVTQGQAREKRLADAVVSTLVMRERATPRESYVMIRGDFLRKGAVVQPGVPAALPPLPTNIASPNRLDFARWLVSPANPLTARVTVNRIWQQHFGIGLVETENDFGKQGTPPSHPELLDYLASLFAASPGGMGNGEDGGMGEWGNGRREGAKGAGRGADASSAAKLGAHPGPQGLGWSMKRLHRLIVTSATYRQSSRARPELRTVDPNNRLLARMPRLRIEAEVIRDVALAASGQLSPKVGGPSVFPPQPGGLDAFTQNKKNWKPSEGEDRFRRGLYTFAWRTSPYAFFATLDAPNGNVTCTRRARSTTPLSALMLANDPAIFEMAQGLAIRVLKEAPAAETERVRWTFRRCLSREPTSAEIGKLLDYYRDQLQSFTGTPADAEKVAPKERPQGSTLAEAAAWTAVARVLMNVDEFITRE